MKVTWIGQAGLVLDTGSLTILIDPYLSDSVAKVNPRNYRRLPADPKVWELKPDVMIFTHDHLDHYDPETAPAFLQREGSMTVLAPGSIWSKARQYGGDHNYVLFDRHTRWTERGVCFHAVKASHSDACAIGVIIDDGQKKYYITGDTLYNEEIFGDLPGDIYGVFLPVNGVGNNMNMVDAKAFAQRIGAQKVIPIHYGMFDSLNIQDFDAENKVVLTPFEEREL